MKAFKPLFVSVLICFTQVSLSQNLQQGLIACYSFSGDANDGSGNQNHGDVFGPTLTNDRFGTANSAYFFDGGDRISIPSGPIVNKQQLTISTWAWIAQNPSYGNAQMVLTIGDASSPYFYGQTLTHHYSSTDFTGWGVGGSNQNLVSVAITTNSLPNTQAWYHLVLTIKPDSVALYINNVRIGRQYTGGAPVYFYQRPSSVAYIGMRSNGTQGFQGAIDDITIHDRVITRTEITALFQNGLPCQAAPAVPKPVVQDASVCENEKATLTASGGTSYRWYDAPINGNLVFEGNPFLTPGLTFTTSYFVSNVQSGTESDREQVTVVVNQNPVLSCDFSASALAGEPVLFSVATTSGTPPYSYQFDFGDGTITNSQDSEQTHIFDEGEFPIVITLTDTHGCLGQCSGEISLDNEQFFIPNVITGNGDLLNDLFTIYSVRDDGYAVYGGEKEFSMYIYSRWGTEVFHTDSATSGWTASGYSTGLYYYKITLGDLDFKGWVSVLR